MQPTRRAFLRGGAGLLGLRLTGATAALGTLAGATGCSGDAPAATASSRPTAAADTDRLQDALAAEHVAVYGYGVVGAWLAGAPRRAALAALDAHRVRRDQLIQLLDERRVAPVAAAAAYELPFPVRDAASAARLAIRLEAGVAKAARALQASADPQLRRLAGRMLADATARQAAWRDVSG